MPFTRTTATAAALVLLVAGVAWAQHRGISGVQVQIDDGDWRDATLSGEVSADTWRTLPPKRATSSTTTTA